jgi:hypothetical protein
MVFYPKAKNSYSQKLLKTLKPIYKNMYKIKLNQIKALLGVEVSLEKLILADGTELSTEKLEVGFPVFDAENNPVGAGEHTLVDGTIFMTDELGVITEVIRIEEEMPEVEAPVEVSIEAAEVEEVAVDPMVLVYETIMELSNEISKLKEKVSTFSKAPAVAPIKKTDNEVIETTFSRLEKLKQIKNQLKK